MKKIKNMTRRGFTLVELLIVIALISILAVAVLATINPIEQANKARDASVLNDAAEVMNAYERYYANSQNYPWMMFQDAIPLTVDSAVLYDSEQVGFGICYGDPSVVISTADPTTCSSEASTQGLLIDADELKASFVGKSSFSTTVDSAPQNGLWLYKATGSGGALYVCYIPKAKSNRQLVGNLYCLNSTGPTRVANGEPGCATPLSDGWSTPDLTGATSQFRCVPE